ncbi:MAG: radical SAM protein [Nanoarchaeota archaeon]|nr:radical SAM protein [Nanoarchaeota archaeon]
MQNTIFSRIFPQGNNSKGDKFYFFSDDPAIDSRISCKDEENLERKSTLVRQRLSSGEKVNLVIALSRYNFFAAHKIAAMCLKLIGEDSDMSWIRLKTEPMSDLTDNFSNYIKEMKSHLPKAITVEMYDKELPAILQKFEELSLSKATSDNDLLRLLGVISEHAFIGPRVMVIDPHHRCNTNCTHCWVHTPGVKHSDEFLNRVFPMDRFRSMIDDAAELKVETIILQGDGEPLLHPNSLEMLKYARKKGLDARFFTNGILLTEDIAKQVVDIGVKEIYCSFPAGSRETYKTINPIQKPETYDRVKQNLKKLMEIKKASGKTDPRVIVTHVIHTQNCHELAKMAEDDAFEGVDAARFYLIRLDVMNKFLQLSEQDIEKIKLQVPKIEKILKEGNVEFVDNIKFQLENMNVKDGSWSKDVFLTKGCTIGWYFNLVPAKGDISFCCHLRTVGDLSKESFKDIWTSPRYRKWRRQGKYMKDNMDVKFQNGQKLFDEHCTHCDNHQMLLEVHEKLKKYDLLRYYKC